MVYLYMSGIYVYARTLDVCVPVVGSPRSAPVRSCVHSAPVESDTVSRYCQESCLLSFDLNAFNLFYMLDLPRSSDAVLFRLSIISNTTIFSIDELNASNFV